MAKTHNNKRYRWSDIELNNFYQAAITNQISLQEMHSLSRMGRTEKAISSKLYKEFDIISRTLDTGEVMFYETDTPTPAITRRRREAVVETQQFAFGEPADTVEDDSVHMRILTGTASSTEMLIYDLQQVLNNYKEIS